MVIRPALLTREKPARQLTFIISISSLFMPLFNEFFQTFSNIYTLVVMRCHHHSYLYWETASREITQSYRPQNCCETQLFPVRHELITSKAQALLLLSFLMLASSLDEFYHESKQSSEYYLVAKDLLLLFSY